MSSDSADLNHAEGHSPVDLGGATSSAGENDMKRLLIQSAELLSRMSQDQTRLLDILARTSDPAPDIQEIAKELWSYPDENSATWHDPQVVASSRVLGLDFLNSLAPCSRSLHPVRGYAGPIVSHWAERHNLAEARDALVDWLNAPDLWSMQYHRPGEAVTPHVSEDLLNEHWPESWALTHDTLDRNSHVKLRFAFPGKVRDPFMLEWPLSNKEQDLTQARWQPRTHPQPLSGMICQISVDRTANAVDLPSAAAMMCLGRGTSHADLLEAHVREWKHDESIYYMVSNSHIVSPHVGGKEAPVGAFFHVKFRYEMRSFTVERNPEEPGTHNDIHPKLKCAREWVDLEGLYGQGSLRHVERRYSTVLSMLPSCPPCGYFALVSAVDLDAKATPRRSRSRVWLHAPGSEEHPGKRLEPWKRYGLYPAGIYTGLSLLQLQLCSFIEAWEHDWNETVDGLDNMVSVKLHVLNDFKRLKSLVLDAKTDKSVLYFKVLQILSIFSDSVRETQTSLEKLVRVAQSPPRGVTLFPTSFPHMSDTRKVLNYNWDIVQTRQREAAERILARLARTTDGVKSLRDGLFNVQTVTEAQKGRTLNKYLLVFTIVTIIFLPPTFVATFFGVEIFHDASVSTTKRTFWAVLGGVSGLTYLAAALGLFGSSLTADGREAMRDSTRAWFDKRLRSRDASLQLPARTLDGSVRGRAELAQETGQQV